jgi:pimeloyl-ACP methyl ester carboxylesterase
VRNIVSGQLNKIFSILIFIIANIVLMNIFFYFFLPSMVFFPFKDINQQPNDWGMEFTDVYLPVTEQKRIHGWFITHPEASHTLLFFHGNAGNISHRKTSIEIFYRLKLNIFIIDYQGYGHSDGSPGEQELKNDALTAWQYLIDTRKLSPNSIIIFGRSLGGAAAIHLASQVEAGALIIESVFSSIDDMAAHQAPGLASLIWLPIKFDNKSVIKQVNMPLLQFHSPDDEIIPYEQGLQVYTAARQPKQFIALKGSHNRGFMLSQPGYELAIKQFIASLE